MSTGANLPPYISFHGCGSTSVLPPGVFQGVTSYCFVLRADPNLMRTLARQFLAAPTDGAWDVDVLGPVAVLMFNYARRMSSPAEVSGWTPNYEALFSFPVALKPRSLLRAERLALWVPYIFIDNGRGMVTGRESWGWAKEIGEILIPPEPNTATKWAVDTTIFPTFSPETQGQQARLIEVVRQDPATPHPSIWTEAGQLLRWFFETMSLDVRDLELLADLVKLWSAHEVPAVNLKLFRDAADGTRACYQSLTTSPLQVRKLHAGGLLSGQYALRVLPCASHPIASQLGLEVNADGTIPILGGAWVEMDFDAVSGETLWQADTAQK